MKNKNGLMLLCASLTLLCAINANAGPPQLGIEVVVSGDGSVTSEPPGIACPSDCDEDYKKGAKIVLTAAATTGASFLGWSGACAGTQPTCQITLVEPTSVSASFSAITASYPAPVLQTGQTTCWIGSQTTNDLQQVDCAGTGQDGELRAGVPIPAPRFIDNSDGTITDATTGLMWVKTQNCIGTRYPELTSESSPGRVYWRVGLDFIRGLNAGTYDCGTPAYTDWRMPNIRELFSLLDYSKTDPRPTSPFVDVARYPMSSTTNLNEPSQGYYLGGYGGEVVRFLKYPDPVGQSGNAWHVWIVRGP